MGISNALASPLGQRGPLPFTPGQSDKVPRGRWGTSPNEETLVEWASRRSGFAALDRQQADYFADSQADPRASRQMSRDSISIETGERDQPRHEDSKLGRISREYVIRNAGRLKDLVVEAPVLAELLCEAIAHLNSSFGGDSIKRIEVVDSDEGASIRVLARIMTGGLSEADAALRDFDEKWWLLNCHRSDGSLVFDYEIGHGF